MLPLFKIFAVVSGGFFGAGLATKNPKASKVLLVVAWLLFFAAFYLKK